MQCCRKQHLGEKLTRTIRLSVSPSFQVGDRPLHPGWVRRSCICQLCRLLPHPTPFESCADQAVFFWWSTGR